MVAPKHNRFEPKAFEEVLSAKGTSLEIEQRDILQSIDEIQAKTALNRSETEKIKARCELREHEIAMEERLARIQEIELNSLRRQSPDTGISPSQLFALLFACCFFFSMTTLILFGIFFL